MRDVTYPPIIVTAKTAFRALGQRFQMTGTEHVPREGGVLLAFNHISYVDFVYGGLPVDRIGRRPRFMAKRELFDHRLTGPIMRACRHIEVDRADGERSLMVARDYLHRGEIVGIFPEATISRAMTIKELKTGAARIAHDARVPLVPMVVWGTQRLMTKDHPRDLSRGLAISVDVGPPVPLTGVARADTASLKDAMAGLLDTAITTYPQHQPGAWWVPATHGGSAPTLAEAARLDAEERSARVARRLARRRVRK
jgi:1-acyl-sn-glycerol-3-phosphate acyltransferase